MEFRMVERGRILMFDSLFFQFCLLRSEIASYMASTKLEEMGGMDYFDGT